VPQPQPIEYQAVRAWLEGLPADQVVGEAGEPYRCPIARFLKSVGASRPYVSYSYYYRARNRGHKYNSPDWLKMTVDDIDRLRRDAQGGVTAGACLEVLNRIGNLIAADL
jgi:hypothetical protein